MSKLYKGLALVFWTLAVAIWAASMGVSSMATKAVELGYGYYDQQDAFKWYEWNPQDNHVT